MSHFALVIPCYNDAQRLAGYLPSLTLQLKQLASPVRIMIVDDGSTEGSSVILPKLTLELAGDAIRFSVLTHQVNKGKGAAVRTGWDAVSDCEWLGFADADGSVDAEEVLRLIRVAENLPARTGLLISERTKSVDHPVTGLKSRYLMGRIFAHISNFLVPTGFKDTQCGFKLIRHACYREIKELLQTDRFAFDVELIAAVKRRGWDISSAPVRWVHQFGGHIRPWRDGWEMLVALLDIRRRILSRV